MKIINTLTITAMLAAAPAPVFAKEPRLAKPSGTQRLQEATTVVQQQAADTGGRIVVA